MKRTPRHAARGPRLDVLGLGCTAIDDLIYVASYPPADGKGEVRSRERHFGGLCATALVAASRLGARCAFAGTLGRDEHSRLVLDNLRREGVDVRRVVRRDGAGPVHSTIIVEEGRGTRTIFNDSSRVLGADPERPPRRFIESARVLLVDRFGMPGMIRAARMAREAGIPVVADFESSRTPGFAELLGLVDHLILSSDFASALTGAVAPSAAAGALWREGRSVVVVTWGDAGCWAVDGPGAPARHIPAFKVKAVDTTGCGDVFRGAYAAALARGLGLEERLRFASAAAALKATRRGGQAGIPRLPEVRGLLKGRAR
ncbi:MAG: hypothetical protein RJA22_2925 [Verrucomicrobiota bacterium]